MSGDELLFPDGQSREFPYLAIQTRRTSAFALTFLGTVEDGARTEALCAAAREAQCAVADRRDGESLSSRITAGVRLTFPDREKTAQIQDTLTWFARDALIHLSAPRGLEQANGGAWGVRDVCQGPVEFLLSYDRADAVADILRRLFAQQYAAARRLAAVVHVSAVPARSSRSHAHGDVLIWPLKALCDYLEHTNDGAILHERVPYTDDETFQPHRSRRKRSSSTCDRLLAEDARSSSCPALALPRYGDGDWDDSLQPADPMLRERMVSAWTAELMYQTLRRYAAALAHFGERDRAAAAHAMADDDRSGLPASHDARTASSRASRSSTTTPPRPSSTCCTRPTRAPGCATA